MGVGQWVSLETHEKKKATPRHKVGEKIKRINTGGREGSEG